MKGGKGVKRKILWGKTNTRKIKCRRTGKQIRVLRRAGEWCRHCYNIWRLRYKQRYKGNMAKFKQDLAGDKKELRKQFDNNHAEYIYQKAGGRSRVSNLKGRVIAKQHSSLKISYPREVFYTVAKYKGKFGDPKKTKARLVRLTIRKGRVTVEGLQNRAKRLAATLSGRVKTESFRLKGVCTLRQRRSMF